MLTESSASLPPPPLNASLKLYMGSFMLQTSFLFLVSSLIHSPSFQECDNAKCVRMGYCRPFVMQQTKALPLWSLKGGDLIPPPTLHSLQKMAFES